MKWLQKNNYVKVLFTAFLLIAIYVVVTDDGKITYEQIKVQHGDTLWSLAEKYRGNMSTKQWIEIVKYENNLNGDLIVIGKELSIPISTDTVLIAQDIEQDEYGVKVATNQQ